MNFPNTKLGLYSKHFEAKQHYVDISDSDSVSTAIEFEDFQDSPYIDDVFLDGGRGEAYFDDFNESACDSEDLSFRHLGCQPFSQCTTGQEHRNRDAFGRAVPKNRTAWRISHDQLCVNYNVLTGEVVPSPTKRPDTVVLPAELDPTVERMHRPNLQRSEEISEELFSGQNKHYVYGSIYEEELDSWTVYWEPSQLGELTTFTVQSTICAALNSRRRLTFVIGVCHGRKIIGCDLSIEQMDKMQELFELCMSSEFVPALDRGLAKFSFYPVHDPSGTRIASRYIAEIAVKDVVTTLYQLSSGRVYYVAGNAVMRTNSFDEAHRMLFHRRKAEFEAALQDPEQKMRWAPCLRDPDDDDVWKQSRLLSFSNLLCRTLAKAQKTHVNESGEQHIMVSKRLLVVNDIELDCSMRVYSTLPLTLTAVDAISMSSYQSEF